MINLTTGQLEAWLALYLWPFLRIGAFQAATQINEMTLSFIPKLIATATTLVIAGPWMLKLIVGYTRELFESIPMLIS